MAGFRDSQYIDFDSGRVAVQPMQLIRSLGPRSDQTLETMLTVFECRVDVWTLGPAVAMLKLMDEAHDEGSSWRHAGYALLAATFSYFEMIGKILNPASARRRTAGVDFNYGFCDVYPGFSHASIDRSDAALPDVRQFRERVRNGIYHLGYTKSHLYIHNNPAEEPRDFAATDQGGSRYYLVNPHSMTRTIVDHFPTLMSRLRDPDVQFATHRAKFIEFYIDYHFMDSAARRV